MIKHVAVFKWKPSFPEQERQEWADRLRALPGKIDVLRTLTVGADVLQGARSWDAAVVAEVNTIDDLPGYLQHPEHQAIGRISAPHIEQVAMVDFDV